MESNQATLRGPDCGQAAGPASSAIEPGQDYLTVFHEAANELARIEGGVAEARSRIDNTGHLAARRLDVLLGAEPPHPETNEQEQKPEVSGSAGIDVLKGRIRSLERQVNMLLGPTLNELDVRLDRLAILTGEKE